MNKYQLVRLNRLEGAWESAQDAVAWSNISNITATLLATVKRQYCQM